MIVGLPPTPARLRGRRHGRGALIQDGDEGFARYGQLDGFEEANAPLLVNDGFHGVHQIAPPVPWFPRSCVARVGGDFFYFVYLILPAPRDHARMVARFEA